MMTMRLGTIMACTALLASSLSYAQDLPPETPIETWNVSITQARPGGSLLVRPCKDCPVIHLQFDAQSQAIANGKPVSLTAIPEHPSKAALTVIYDPKTRVIRRVIW